MTSHSEILLSQTFSPATRLMIFAPHPDDEALGNGALIQLALAAGAKVRVVFLTDGDNNPWPQRAQERCWAIDSAARLRWGLRRRGESIRALQTLGLRAEDGIFLGLPDQGLTVLWNRRDPLVIARLAAELKDFSPTLISVPSAADRHPDHRSGFAFVQAALHLAGLIAPQWAYLIHRPWFQQHPSSAEFDLPLTRRQKAAKLAAIRCHQTQLLLSRGRFTAYARDWETFTAVGADSRLSDASFLLRAAPAPSMTPSNQRTSAS
jgi:LmbE family N-acetylglucosaminyl deacetylase